VRPSGSISKIPIPTGYGDAVLDAEKGNPEWYVAGKASILAQLSALDAAKTQSSGMSTVAVSTGSVSGGLSGKSTTLTSELQSVTSTSAGSGASSAPGLAARRRRA
jgi:hypothetical protein